MLITRREFVKQGAIASAAVSARTSPLSAATVQSTAQANPVPVRVGMTDWNLGQRGDITKIALAREIARWGPVVKASGFKVE